MIFLKNLLSIVRSCQACDQSMQITFPILTLSITGLLLLGFQPAHSAEVDASQCALKQIASFTVTLTPNGMISIPLKINDSEQQFVVALGQPYSAISTDLAGQQQLVVHSMSSSWHLAFFSYMGQNSSYIAYIPKLGLDHAYFPNAQMLMLQAPVSPGTSGVIGDDVLSNFDVELNLKSHKLSLFSPEHCPGNVVYWGRSYIVLPMSSDSAGNPEFGMLLDGKPVTAEFLTTNSIAVLNGGSAKAIFGIVPPPPPPPVKARIFDMVNRGPEVVDSGPAMHHAFSELKLDGITIKNLNVVVSPDLGNGPCQGDTTSHAGLLARCSGGHDLSLGLAELNQLRMYFAFREKNLYVTAPDSDGSVQEAPAGSIH